MNRVLVSRSRVLPALAIVLAVVGCAALTSAGYMNAKAALAQVLLERAWERVQSGDAQARPWPWADTVPVARLHVPRLRIDRIVLRGDSGRTLAFAPGWTESSAAPATPGTSVLSAHRDTHFAFLRELVIGDPVTIQSATGTREYRVESLRVVDSRLQRIDLSSGFDGVLLVTCWPFDALDARGPLRYVVTAVALDAEADNGPALALTLH